MVEKVGRYEILEVLGQGGFAVVHRGRDTILDRPVALKELKPILLGDAEWVQRFHREAKTIARLDHPRIVPIYDIYELDRRLFIIMRLVEGPSLEELIASKKRLAWSEAYDLLSGVADGLAYAHTQNILHRDLKPANILIDAKQGPMLSDFGLAKLTSESSMSLSASGTIVGTPHYIAPEIWEGKKNTIQSDLYALGCILYEALTGEKIFKGDTPPAVMMAHFTPLSLPQTWPDAVPAGLTEVLAKALARHPDDRYGSAAELMAALAALPNDQAPASQPIAAIPAGSETLQPSITTGSPTESMELAQLPSPPADDPAQSSSIDEEPPVKSSPSITLNPPAPASTAAPAQITPPVRVAPSQPATVEDSGALSPADRRPRTGRRGCLWLGLGLLVVAFLGVIGLGNFCSLLNRLNAINSPTAALIARQTEPINVPLPTGSDPAEIEINFGAGELNIAPGADGALIAGTATYNIAQLKPTVARDNEQVVIEPEAKVNYSSLPDGAENRWDLTLGSYPMELSLNTGIATSHLELGGLQLEELRVVIGAAEGNISFAEPNLTPMNSLRFTAGATHAELTGLANAYVEDIIFKGGAGDYTLDFSGELRQDLDVEIDAGLGQVTLRVPETTRATVSVSDLLSSVEATGAWLQSTEDDSQYSVASDTAQEYEITITLRIGGGNLKLETM
ncbi:MAG: protein kinase [Anaerolineaceae bacterium]|nr:protein kinase [Anaerolineaceae bacterium]MCB9098188.1 protein kinase [Anaerolineales bacterium]